MNAPAPAPEVTPVPFRIVVDAGCPQGCTCRGRA